MSTPDAYVHDTGRPGPESAPRPDLCAGAGAAVGEAPFRAALGAMLDAAVTVDATGRVVDWDTAAEATFGYPRAEAVGRRVSELIVPPASRPAHERGLARSFAAGGVGGPVRAVELTAVRADGGEFPARMVVVPGPAGGPPSFTAYVRDLTDRRGAADRAEAEAGERRFRSLAEATAAVVWGAGASGQFEAEQPGWSAFTGRPFDDSRRGGWVEAVHPDDREAARRAWEAAVAARTPFQDEHRLLRRDGEYRQMLARAVPVAGPGGAAAGWVGLHTDVTELKRAEEEVRRLNRELGGRVRDRTEALERANAELKDAAARLEASNRELQEFASVASHDLQEPLRKIQAFGDRLAARCAAGLGDDGRDYLGRMLAAAGRMRTLIDDLLAFARVTTQARPASPIDLGRVAREVVSDLEGRLAETGGRVEVGDLPAVRADPSQARQLLQNLIANGLKFRRPGVAPVITVTGRDAGGGFCEVAVADNGIGFEEKYLDRIFNVFQRLHGRHEYEGTGVGLAICRKIVERHGGALTAQSAPGLGSTFLATLPAAPGPEKD